MTELRRVNVDIKFPHLRAYLPSFPSPHVADGQQRQETANLVRPPWSLSSPVPTELAHSSSKCSAFDLGIFHFSDTLQTKNAIFDNLYHLICNFVSVSCELTPRIQSVHSSRARGKSMASWHCTVEFHSPCTSSFGYTVLTLEDRQMGTGAFRIKKLVVQKIHGGGAERHQHGLTDCSSKVW